MAKYAKISALSFERVGNPYPEFDPEKLKIMMMNYLKEQFERVVDEKPDLIIFPEGCNRPNELSSQQKKDYLWHCRYEMEDMMSSLAKKHKVNIAYGGIRLEESDKDFPFRNSLVYFDRKGEVAGIYDKCFLVPTEHTISRIGFGKIPEKLIELDFGSVASAICFDMHDEDLLARYAKLDPDLIVFSSFFKAIGWADMWALSCRSYFAASLVLHESGRIINPFGTVIANTNNTRHATAVINFDYKVVHNDDNQDWRTFKFDAARKKYGQKFNWINSNGGGMSIIQSDVPDKSIEDIMQEFDMMGSTEYFGITKSLRREYYEKIGFDYEV
jgi:predicted amidohydrolase